MKAANLAGLLVILMNVVGLGFATTVNFSNGVAKAKVIAALKARDMSADEIKEIVNLMPRANTVTVTTTEIDCPSYGPPATASIPATTESPTSSTLATAFESLTSSTPPESGTVNTETPSEAPSVPITSTPVVETTSEANSTPPVQTSIETTPGINTSVPTSATSSSVESTSTTTETEISTTFSSRPTVTSTTSTIPPAPNNGASTAGLNVALAGVVAMLAFV
ncbi:uncharacterized protein Z518_04848 [Rhinocladiella mackenziei CBS 650.93]|uniref:Uncharacterized protein n=1 Tax=Rhinocladiella mackenziei CBS 650.93 TaxID=1442369 RepID=A0A0D2FX13_9EURO|nr:uncharacterized protein Z518_04848 [Rhinocladiella mackenziei CBS 650.93]KIX06872.1 hypothetical protein Z518_04848 [Rhinocladiella mackenziei CBS 650.93]